MAHHNHHLSLFNTVAPQLPVCFSNSLDLGLAISYPVYRVTCPGGMYSILELLV